MEFETAVDIAAPPEAVWAVMSDVARWHEWTASITSIEPLDEPAPAVGRRFRVRQPRFPAVVWRVTQVEPGRSFVWEAKSPGGKTVGEHRVEPAPGGSTATLAVRATGLLPWLLRGWMSRITREYVSMEAAGLKRRCEGR